MLPCHCGINSDIELITKVIIWIIIMLSLIACSPEEVRPLGFDDSWDRRLSEITVTAQNKKYLHYKINYNNKGQIKEITEVYWGEAPKPDTNRCAFTYANDHLIHIQWQGIVDYGIMGNHVHTVIDYRLDYDTLGALLRVGSVSNLGFAKTAEMLPSTSKLQSSILLSYANRTSRDTMLQIMDTTNHTTTIATNHFYDIVYKKSTAELNVKTISGQWQNRILYSQFANKLPYNLWTLIQDFIEKRERLQKELHLSLLRPDVYFFFDQYMQDCYGVFPYGYETASFNYTMDQNGNVKSIVKSNNASNSEMIFKY